MEGKWSKVYFPNGFGMYPAGWYPVNTDDYNCDDSQLDVWIESENRVVKIQDEWGFCDFRFLPFNVAWNGRKWFRWLFYGIMVLLGILIFKK